MEVPHGHVLTEETPPQERAADDPYIDTERPTLREMLQRFDGVLAGERWRPVPGYEDRYAVSDHGRVLSLVGRNQKPRSKPKLLRPYVNECHHHRYVLGRDGEREVAYLHLLVLEAFVGPCPDGKVGMHLDGDRDNNHLSNLAYGTRGEVIKRTYGRHGREPIRGEQNAKAKLTAADVRRIRRIAANGISPSYIARSFPVSRTQIRRIILRETWAHVK